MTFFISDLWFDNYASLKWWLWECVNDHWHGWKPNMEKQTTKSEWANGIWVFNDNIYETSLEEWAILALAEGNRDEPAKCKNSLATLESVCLAKVLPFSTCLMSAIRSNGPLFICSPNWIQSSSFLANNTVSWQSNSS